VQKKPSKAAKRVRDCKDLKDEAKTESAPEKLTCPKCDKTFENTSNVIRHLKNIHKVKARAPELKASVANMGQYKCLPCKYCRKMLTNLAMHRCAKKMKTEEAKPEAGEEEEEEGFPEEPKAGPSVPNSARQKGYEKVFAKFMRWMV